MEDTRHPRKYTFKAGIDVYTRVPTGIKPTIFPTTHAQSPTFSPTSFEPSLFYRSNTPSYSATEYPTQYPTEFPSEYPTIFPSEYPTEFPTYIPTPSTNNVVTVTTSSPSFAPTVSSGLSSVQITSIAITGTLCFLGILILFLFCCSLSKPPDTIPFETNLNPTPSYSTSKKKNPKKTRENYGSTNTNPPKTNSSSQDTDSRDIPPSSPSVSVNSQDVSVEGGSSVIGEEWRDVDSDIGEFPNQFRSDSPTIHHQHNPLLNHPAIHPKRDASNDLVEFPNQSREDSPSNYLQQNPLHTLTTIHPPNLSPSPLPSPLSHSLDSSVPTNFNQSHPHLTINPLFGVTPKLSAPHHPSTISRQSHSPGHPLRPSILSQPSPSLTTHPQNSGNSFSLDANLL